MELGVQLGQRVRLVDASHCDVPHGGSLHDVADDKLLDGLVLGHATSAVGAPYGLDVTATVLGATVVSPFRRLKRNQRHPTLISLIREYLA